MVESAVEASSPSTAPTGSAKPNGKMLIGLISPGTVEEKIWERQQHTKRCHSAWVEEAFARSLSKGSSKLFR